MVIWKLFVSYPEETRALANCHDGEALIEASANRHLEVVRFLVTEGPVQTCALANCQDGAALTWAARYGRLEVVRFLVNDGPEETRALANCHNGRALIWAAETGQSEVVRGLLQMSINTGNFFTEDQFLQALNADAIQNFDENTRNELEDIFNNVHLK